MRDKAERGVGGENILVGHFTDFFPGSSQSIRLKTVAFRIWISQAVGIFSFPAEGPNFQLLLALCPPLFIFNPVIPGTWSFANNLKNLLIVYAIASESLKFMRIWQDWRKIDTLAGKPDFIDFYKVLKLFRKFFFEVWHYSWIYNFTII